MLSAGSFSVVNTPQLEQQPADGAAATAEHTDGGGAEPPPPISEGSA